MFVCLCQNNPQNKQTPKGISSKTDSKEIKKTFLFASFFCLLCCCCPQIIFKVTIKKENPDNNRIKEKINVSHNILIHARWIIVLNHCILLPSYDLKHSQRLIRALVFSKLSKLSYHLSSVAMTSKIERDQLRKNDLRIDGCNVHKWFIEDTFIQREWWLMHRFVSQLPESD